MARMAWLAVVLAAGAALPAAAQIGPISACGGRLTVSPSSRPGPSGSIQYFALVTATGGELRYVLAFTPPPPAFGAPPVARIATAERSFVVIGTERRDPPTGPASVPLAQMPAHITVTCP